MTASTVTDRYVVSIRSASAPQSGGGRFRRPVHVRVLDRTASEWHVKIEDRIKEIEATERALIGSDEGTHGKPGNYRLYEEITGERYAVYSFAGANGSRCTIQEATDETEGRINWFASSQVEIDGLQKELEGLRTKLRKHYRAR